jgi:hypothetical protein
MAAQTVCSIKSLNQLLRPQVICLISICYFYREIPLIMSEFYGISVLYLKKVIRCSIHSIVRNFLTSELKGDTPKICFIVYDQMEKYYIRKSRLYYWMHLPLNVYGVKKSVLTRLNSRKTLFYSH